MKFCVLTILTLMGLGGIAIGQEPPQCPSLRVIGPSGITTPGDDVTFVVDTTAETKELKFHWTVSGGIIEKGQGTTAIKVRTSRADSGKTIEATVDVQGFETGCSSRAWENAPIETIPEGGVWDEFANLEPNDVRARMDGFFLALQDNPTNTGYIVIQILDDEELSESNPRFQLLVEHIQFRELDPDRIKFMFEPIGGPKTGYSPYTKLYRVPPGAEEPPCDDCVEVRPIPLQ